MLFKTILIALLSVTVATSAGCIYASPAGDRAEKTRSLLHADKVLVMTSADFPLLVSDKTTPFAGLKKPNYEEGRQIMAFYGLTNPVNGVIDVFLQSLPPGVVAGEVLHAGVQEIAPDQLDGWINFVGSSWELEKIPFAGYRFNYSVYVKILRDSGMIGRDGSIFMDTLWQEECLTVKPGAFKGYPLNTWLENNAALLKTTIADVQKSCGQQLALGLVNFLKP